MAVRTRRDAGILSLPGIDTSGPRELSCRYDAEELELAKAGSPYARSGTRRRGQGAAGGHEIVSDPLNHDAAVEKFVFAACGGSERLAAPAAASPSPSATSQSAPAPAPAAAASSSGGGSGEDGVSVFEAYLSKTRVAEHVAAAEALLATAREAVAGFRVEAAAAVAEAEAEAASSSGGGFAGMKALVEAEQRVARLEAVVGRAPTRLDRAAEGSVAEQLRVVAERLEGVAAEGAGAAAAAAAGGGGGGSAAARQHASLAAALARANELILSRKSAYAAASTSSLAARTAILYNVLQSVEGVADVLPSVVARLQQVKRITDEASSAAREPSAAADAEADASIGAAFASLQKLSASDASAALVAECAKLPDTAARMDSLADRLAALGL